MVAWSGRGRHAIHLDNMPYRINIIYNFDKIIKVRIYAMKLKDACSLEGKLNQPRQHIKKQRHYFANKGPSSQSYGFSSGHVWM